MILIDTSVWIDFFKDLKTTQTDLVIKSIKNNDNICICGIILTEILQGIKSNPQYHAAKDALEPLIYLPMQKESYYLASSIYRKARSKGATIRNTVDCLIAACAITHDAQLIQNDKDFIEISKHSSLKIVK